MMTKYKQPVITIARFTFIEAIRNRLFLLIMIGLICVFGLAQFIGELAITETLQVQGAIIGLVLRLFAVFMVCLFIITSMVREFNDKTFEFIISLPVSRYVYFCGKFIGFCLLAFIVTIIISFLLMIYAELPQILIWCVSLICELIILIALCLFVLFTLGHVVISFSAVIGFYVLARSMSTIQLIGHSPIMETTSKSQSFINFLIDTIAYILPDLNSFTQTSWLVYNTGTVGDLINIIIQTVIYVVLLSSAALFDLYRKEF